MPHTLLTLIGAHRMLATGSSVHDEAMHMSLGLATAEAEHTMAMVLTWFWVLHRNFIA